MDADAMAGQLPSWRAGATRTALIAFLRESSQGRNAVPPEERIAAFDNDGTLACEKPRTSFAAFLDSQLHARHQPEREREQVSGHAVLREVGALFAGATTADYDTAASEFLSRAVHPRFRRPYPSLTYQPMLELLGLLHILQFSVFLCTDSSRDFIRVIAGPCYGLRRERVIGSEVQIESVAGRLVRTGIPVPLDDGPGKTVHLWDRTGAQPILAAGNAAGDIAMLSAARHALVLHHDDSAREYAYTDPQIMAAAAANGWTVLSMRADFTRLWPTGAGDTAP